MQVRKMNYVDCEPYDSDNSDCLIINDNFDDFEEKPKLGTLLIKKGPNGYTVEKGKEKKPSPAEKLIKPSNQSMFYMVPILKNQPLNREELSKIYKEYIGKLEIHQDPFIDSTKSVSEDLEHCTTNLVEGDFENISEQNSFSHELRYSSVSEFENEETFESRINSSTLDPIVLSRSIGGGYFVKKDCFLGGKSRNLTELEELSRNSYIEKKINYSDMQLEEPVLEKLFSNVTNASQNSQASTNTIHSSDDLDCATDTEINNDDFCKTVKNEVDEDGSLLVIHRSNSDVVVVGYD